MTDPSTQRPLFARGPVDPRRQKYPPRFPNRNVGGATDVDGDEVHDLAGAELPGSGRSPWGGDGRERIDDAGEADVIDVEVVDDDVVDVDSEEHPPGFIPPPGADPAYPPGGVTAGAGDFGGGGFTDHSFAGGAYPGGPPGPAGPAGPSGAGDAGATGEFGATRPRRPAEGSLGSLLGMQGAGAAAAGSTPPVDPLTALAEWAEPRAGGLWPLAHRIELASTSSGGWRLSVPLAGTPLAERRCRGGLVERSATDYLRYGVHQGTFVGLAGPLNLAELVRAFTDFAAEADLDDGAGSGSTGPW